MSKTHINCDNCLRIVKVIKIRVGGCTECQKVETFIDSGLRTCNWCGQDKPVNQMFHQTTKAGDTVLTRVCEACWAQKGRLVKGSRLKPVQIAAKPATARSHTCARCGETKRADEMQIAGRNRTVSKVCRACWSAHCRRHGVAGGYKTAEKRWGFKMKPVKTGVRVCESCHQIKPVSEMSTSGPGGKFITKNCKPCYAQIISRARRARQRV